jgi:hypothetical protein
MLCLPSGACPVRMDLAAQITLPHRHGGLGLSHTGPTDGVTEYLATATTAPCTAAAMSCGYKLFR